MRFDSRAEWYVERSTVQHVVADWCSENLDTNVSQLAAVEFGAGPGLFTRHLASCGFRSLLATDLSPRMVAEGRKRVPGALWRVEDAWQPRVGRTDRIFACSLLQWAPSPIGVLQRWKDLLRPGGRVVAALFVEGSMGELIQSAPGIEAVAWMSPEAWLSCVEAAGFRVRSSAVRRDTFYFPNAFAALRSVHGIGAVGPRRFGPGSMRALLRQIDQNRLPGKPQALTWVSLRFEAEA